MSVEARTDEGLTNQDVKDGAIIFGGIAFLVGTRGALRGGSREIGRQYDEIKGDIPEDASRIDRIRFAVPKINLRLVCWEAQRGAIKEFKKFIYGPEKDEPTAQEPISIDFRSQTLQRAA
jgi:hypothetical protein